MTYMNELSEKSALFSTQRQFSTKTSIRALNRNNIRWLFDKCNNNWTDWITQLSMTAKGKMIIFFLVANSNGESAYAKFENERDKNERVLRTHNRQTTLPNWNISRAKITQRGKFVDSQLAFVCVRFCVFHVRRSKTALTYSDTFCGLLMRTDSSCKRTIHTSAHGLREQRQNDRLFGVIIMRSPHCEAAARK